MFIFNPLLTLSGASGGINDGNAASLTSYNYKEVFGVAVALLSFLEKLCTSEFASAHKWCISCMANWHGKRALSLYPTMNTGACSKKR